jgi:hypothetical protein
MAFNSLCDNQGNQQMTKKRQTRRHSNPQRKGGSTRTPSGGPVKNVVNRPERGGLLTAAIILVILHGLIILGVAYGESALRDLTMPPWFVPAILGIAVADIVAGIALWYWKGWGFYLYLGATIAAIVLGVAASGFLMFAFSRIIPFVIVGYIMRPKWKYFSMGTV